MHTKLPGIKLSIFFFFFFLPASYKSWPCFNYLLISPQVTPHLPHLSSRGELCLSHFILVHSLLLRFSLFDSSFFLFSSVIFSLIFPVVKFTARGTGSWRAVLVAGGSYTSSFTFISCGKKREKEGEVSLYKNKLPTHRS